MAFKFDLTQRDAARVEEQKEVQVTMPLIVHPKREFMARFERYEPLIKDSTAISTLKKCPRMYFYQIVLGRVANQDYVVFAWGTAYHKFREALEIAYGIGRKPYNREAALDALKIAIKVGYDYWKKKGKDQPADSKWAYMTTDRLLKMFRVAFDHWEAEKQRGRIEVIAVEQAFNIQLNNGIRIGGRADQLVRWNGRLWGRDFKTSSQDSAFFARSLEPNDQFTRYTLADSYLTGEIVQGQFVEVMYNAKPTKKDSKGPLIIELSTSRTKTQLDQFEKEQAVIERTLQVYREEDTWPMHEANCPFCPYHSVCTKPTEAGQMAQLEQNFTVRPWDYNKVGTTEE